MIKKVYWGEEYHIFLHIQNLDIYEYMYTHVYYRMKVGGSLVDRKKQGDED